MSTGLHAPKVIAITSGTAGVGKTTVAANLAAALAARGQQVLVLDADGVHRQVAARFGLQYPGDISDVLAESDTVESILWAGPAWCPPAWGNLG
jgi:flagellar biosynthesis protein FlhG